MRDSFEQLTQRGLIVLAISTDSVETQAKFAQAHQLEHTLLADPDGATAKAYGVYNPIGIANRVTYIVDPNGTIAKVFPKAATATHAAELLAYLDERDLAKPLPIGKRSPDFTLTDVMNNQAIHLYDLKGKKGFVILFLSAECPVTNAYVERINTLANEFQPRGIQFISIYANATESKEQIVRHAQEKAFSFPILRDDGHKIADQYRAQVTPEVFVLDGNFVLRYHGRIDNYTDPTKVTKSELRDALSALAAGQPIAVPEKPAFGCTIKRNK